MAGAMKGREASLEYEALRQFGLELVPKCLAAECLPVHCLEGMFPSSAA